MKLACSTFCALLILVASPLFAAKRIQMEVTDLTNNKVTSNEILLDADRMRVDSGDTTVMFLSKGGNRLVMLDKKANQYREMDQATMDQMAAQLGGAMAQMEEAMKNMPPAQRAQMEQLMKGKLGPAAAPVLAPVTYAAKGAGTAGSFRCTNYEGTRSGQKVSEICAAPLGEVKLSPADFQVMQKMQEFIGGMMKAMQSSPIANMIPAAGSNLTEPGIEGLPVQTISYTNGKAVSKHLLKSVTDASLTDADFSTGAATKAEMPGMPSGPGKAAKGKGK